MLFKPALTFLPALALFQKECEGINIPSQHYGPQQRPNADQRPLQEHDQGPLKGHESRFEATFSAPPILGNLIPQAKRDKWVVKCESEETDHGCGLAYDAQANTYWQSKAGADHSITIDLGEVDAVNAISVKPRTQKPYDTAITAHKLFLSLDGKAWGNPIAFGTWNEDDQDKFAIFEPEKARFVRLEAFSGASGNRAISIVDLNVWSTKTFTPQARGGGKWGPTINFPLVPVGVFVDPPSGKVVTFSSFVHDAFNQDGTKHFTFTATWSPGTGIVSQKIVRDTKHDMFCPGMAFDVKGRMIITGGSDASKVSIYDPTSENWISAAEMKIARGYQGSTPVADGRIFVIGGSWAPNGVGAGKRNGEIYDPESNKWEKLSGCPALPIQTTEDWEKEYRADNHVWLLGWKGNSIFHAGPSKNMNWISTNGQGEIKPAGARVAGDLKDADAMCGVASMYDAVAGKILTTGGAPQYKYWDDRPNPWVVKGKEASNNSFIITLGEVNAPVKVSQAGSGMLYPRIFHHAVILPAGDVFVVGGQVKGHGFTDQTPQLTPEIYSPKDNKFTAAAPNSVVRVYHSFGLLLPDATVIVGGGGLCGGCQVNHLDAQIYTPEYLLTDSGDRAPRPAIKKLSKTVVLPGDKITVTTLEKVDGASLVRYSGATHSVNNDQRRIELKLSSSGELQYDFTVPSEGGIALPGYWMLFVINAAGVPSVASNVQILVQKTK